MANDFPVIEKWWMRESVAYYVGNLEVPESSTVYDLLLGFIA